jgi:hypothetical protein
MANKQIDGLTAKSNPVIADKILVWDSAEAGAEAAKSVPFSNLTEVGTWTPQVADAVSGGNTGSAGTALGYYRRVGEIVHIMANLTNIDTTGMTAGNVLYIRDLPYSVGGIVFLHVGTVWTQSVTIEGLQIVARLETYNSVLYLTELRSNDGDSNLIVSDYISGSADILLDMTYFA